MLSGTADVEALARRSAAPTIDAWTTDDLVLDEVTSLQLIVELRRHDRQQLLPPGLHPTDPPSLHIHCWQVGGSPWGPFTWAHTRLSCRSGVRARALTTAAVVDRSEAATGLSERFGFPVSVADVDLAVHYDSASAEVRVDGVTTLEVVAVDPTPLALDAVQATSTMNLAHTPLGLRLIQVEARHDVTSVERLHGEVRRFDAGAWGDERLDPYDVVSAVVVRDASVTLPHVRFVCRPDASAFEGTERVDGS